MEYLLKSEVINLLKKEDTNYWNIKDNCLNEILEHLDNLTVYIPPKSGLDIEPLIQPCDQLPMDGDEILYIDEFDHWQIGRYIHSSLSVVYADVEDSIYDIKGWKLLPKRGNKEQVNYE